MIEVDRKEWKRQCIIMSNWKIIMISNIITIYTFLLYFRSSLSITIDNLNNIYLVIIPASGILLSVDLVNYIWIIIDKLRIKIIVNGFG
jgi:hypothetical protein